MTYWREFMSACLSKDRHSFVLVWGWSSVAPGRGGGRRGGATSNRWHLQLATGLPVWKADRHPGGKPHWCWISVTAGPGRSKVTEMTARSALQVSCGLRGRHVFLIELQLSGGSLILISGDRNPIFRGDSWESGSPCVREMTVSL